MHVLFLPSWYPTTEAPQTGVYFAEQARLLSEHGLQVGVVYPEQQSLRRLSWKAARRKHFQTRWSTENGIPTLRRHGWNVWWRAPPGLRCRVRSAVRLTDRYIDRYGRPDLIHAQSAHWAAAAAARIRSRRSIPYVLTEHFSGLQGEGRIFPWRWPLVEEGFRHAEGVAAVSTALKAALTARNLAPAADIAVHPNPVRASLFTRPPDGRPTPPPFRFVTVTRLTPVKDVATLLEAFGRSFPDSEDVRLTIIGSGPERDRLERQATQFDVGDQVFFRGSVDRQSVRNALWKAHAFVLPSRQETFGVALVEAMATGLPVIATRCGGPEDIVTPETGRLLPARDPEALADALQSLRRTWSSFSASAIRARALDRFGPASFVRRTLAFYQRAVAA